jgi:ribosome-binding factor A
MSQRVAKVESVIQAVVAPALLELLEADAAQVTVTRVDAAPDLRSATVWIGLLGTEPGQERLWRVSRAMTMKYAPQLHLKRDTGGAYAEEIERLLRGL